MYIVKFCDNYADEFEVYGTSLITEEQYIRLFQMLNLINVMNKIKNYYLNDCSNDDLAYECFIEETEISISLDLIKEIAPYIPNHIFEIGFGTNESLIYDDFETLIGSIDFIQVTDQEVEFLKRVGLDSFASINDIFGRIEDYLYPAWIWDEINKRNDLEEVEKRKEVIDTLISKLELEIGNLGSY